MSFSVKNEVGQLKTVMVHRPGLEMSRLSPSNKTELLFDDVLWLKRAQEEHDKFSQKMTDQGVEVLHFQELLATSLENPQAREAALKHTLIPSQIDPRLHDGVEEHLAELDSTELAEKLVAGISASEYAPLVGADLPDDAQLFGSMVLACLPNHLFMRDSSAWYYGYGAVNRMSRPARWREALHLELIYRFHPRFAQGDWKRIEPYVYPLDKETEKQQEQYLDGLVRPTELGDNWLPQHAPDDAIFDFPEASLEGGDVLVLGNGALMIGISERTTFAGVQALAQNLLADPTVKTVLAVRLPHAREFMHLDTVMTMVDYDSFIAYQGLGMAPSVAITRGTNGQLHYLFDEGEGFYDQIARALEVPQIEVLVPFADPLTAERDQWNDACNLLALAPRKVMAYERNEAANQFLRDRGIEVLEVAGSELGRGRGGPRCMTCPVDRDE
ncbi:hypothetical protein BK816_02800 [Boudabousia tangfeifanii]|uniref:Arginine deiminase n=1 Tax=Boudabousia tangfeifanii TaxID=1912795 RepID=A0A1D9MJ98_9ACTO|nr:arginine deiminase family protein [Boudabousia tangfeifanii]AOZ72362.1 hypothetical protein BK816_02800 [Boudabousia tangfeifanii]